MHEKNYNTVEIRSLHNSPDKRLEVARGATAASHLMPPFKHISSSKMQPAPERLIQRTNQKNVPFVFEMGVHTIYPIAIGACPGWDIT